MGKRPVQSRQPAEARRRWWPQFTSVMVVIAVVATVGAPASAAAPAASGAPAGASVPDSIALTERVLVRWSDPVDAAAARSPARLAALRAASGGRPAFVRLAQSGYVVYDLGRRLGAQAPALLAALRTLPGVEAVSADYLLRPADMPNDPLGAQLWGLIDGATLEKPYGVDALAAWPYTTGAGIVVAVVDTGLVAHPEFAGQTVAGYDMISNTAIANDGGGRDADPSDPGDWVTSGFCGSGWPAQASSWHGTHVAGTIGALANNGIGVFGGAPGVKVQPVRVLGRCGGHMSDVADAIRWAGGGSVSGVPTNATPARVINLSLSGGGDCETYLQNAITSARNGGAVVVAAAGNSGSNARDYAPANCAGVLTVVATTSAGKRAGFSNYGSSSGGVVELAAPGVMIWSTVDSGSTSPAGPTYQGYDGTSMAAPHVSLAAALVLGLNPGLSVAQVEALLAATSTPFPPDNTSNNCYTSARCGAGIVHAGRAIAAMVSQGPPGAPPAVSATAGDGQALVAWTAPTSVGAGPITGYTATSSPGSQSCSTSGALSCTVGGLDNGTSYTFTVTAANAIGTSDPSAPSNPVTPAVLDTTPPTVTAPVTNLAAGAQLGTKKVPLVVAWSGSDASSIASYQLQQSKDGGSWATVALASPTATSASLLRPPGSTYRFRVRATDGAGNISGWATAATLKLVARQEGSSAISYSGTWTRASVSTAYGGALRHAKASTARATMTFTGRSIAWVAQLGAKRGVADVYLDGVLVATVDLFAASGDPRRMVFTHSWATSSKHTIQIRVRGTTDRPRVDLDAFLFLK